MSHKKITTHFLFLTTCLFFSLTGLANSYYLSSSSGNDNNSGKDPSSPWRSLDKLNSTRNFSAGDNIYLKRGDTFYGSITISNSGSSGSPITFGAYGSGDDPVISGFTTVNSWKNLGGNIWESSDEVSSLSSCNMVAVNNVNTPMGRYPNSTSPNTGYLTIKSHLGASSLSGNGLSGSPNWTGAEVVIRKTKYYLDRAKVTSQSGSTLYYKGNSMSSQNGYGFFIQNDPRTLDLNGEWYYNPSTKKIRIYSYSTPRDVKVASIENIVNVSGAYVTFDNLNITGANTYGFYASYSARHDVSIQNCDISFAGIAGIYADQPDITIQNNHLSYLNSDGIKIVRPNSRILNNIVRNVNVFEGMGQNDAMGGICVTGQNTTIQNNEVDSSGFKGIIFNGSNSVIKNNFVNYYCFVREDGAGIYTGGNGSSNSTIDGNIILNGIGAGKGCLDSLNNDLSGISVDDYGTGITISNNTVANCVSIGIKLHLANNIILKNNTTYNNGGSSWSKGGLEILFDDSNPVKNISLDGNIFFAKTAEQLSFFASSNNTEGIKALKTNNNYFAKPIDTKSLILINENSFNLLSWQSFINQDMNSKTSPKSISNLKDLRFEYNATDQSKTIPLDATYIDVKNKSYNGSITLAPYSSAVLIKNGTATETAPLNLLPAVNPSNTVNGVDYKYYEADNYTALPSFTSLTPVKIGNVDNFDISPANSSKNFSFDFTGYIDVPVDGQYTFYTNSDDGSNLRIDGVPVVNNDGLHSKTEKSGNIGLKAGKHAIAVGFFQQGWDKSLSVSYAGPEIKKQKIPSSSLYRPSTNSTLLSAVDPSNIVNGLDYKYFEASNYTVLPSFNSLIAVKKGTINNFDLTPANSLNNFSFNFTGYIYVPTDGQYTFYTTSDDGSNLVIDGVSVVDNDGLHSLTEQSGTIGLKAGKHAIAVGFFQQGWDKSLSVSYAGPGIEKQKIPAADLYRPEDLGNLLPAVYPLNTVNGLDYKYYQANNYTVLPDFSSLSPVKTGIVNNFDISVANRTSTFSFDFGGYIDVPADGQYTFYTNSDDGSNLYIDNILIVNNDGLHSLSEKSGTVGLQAGKHIIRVEYFQQYLDHTLKVSYTGPGISKRAIPSSALYKGSTSVLERALINSTTALMSAKETIGLQPANNFSNNLQDGPGIKVFPNPFRNSIQINVNSLENSKFKLVLMNAAGQIVWNKEVDNYSFSYHETVNTSNLPIGLYFLNLIQNNKTTTYKLVKQY